MTKTFEYQAKIVVDAQIEIGNICNCAIMANNDLGYTWVMVIKTDLGETEVFEYGPFIIGLDNLLEKTNSSYKRFDCNDEKISKIIDKFLNDGYRMITQAQEIDCDEAIKYFKNLGEFI